MVETPRTWKRIICGAGQKDGFLDIISIVPPTYATNGRARIFLSPVLPIRLFREEYVADHERGANAVIFFPHPGRTGSE